MNFKLHRKVVQREGSYFSLGRGGLRASAGQYWEVEVGYPSEGESLIAEYAEDPSKPTDTVYGYVPVNTIYLIITKHGGMVAGQVPSGVPVYEHYKID